ncbi:DUF47 domain-containing protein [Desulfovibrio litoralis]|uniref:TIGR00153 family protein n=1 Tax=Desulfovibrio litoralis DSM 11393 TaxID=1121455 RepID=A0A1M7TKH8_9BACT|nr:DUF47 family protein [Desulfovibrio litoralis]SHN71215.1 hypothetical protein SAMN02745728_02164 [Desulfovibrio litoralis DSM 11393]
MIRLPLFGLLSPRSPMLGLMKHYECIEKGMKLVEESLECYILSDTNGECREFRRLQEELNLLEEQADKIKRNVRNHLPAWLMMPVDRTLIFSYTRHQDDILNEGQRALHWLSMRQFVIPEDLQKDLIYYIAEVYQNVQLLKIALTQTVDFINGDDIDRETTKQSCRNVRKQHKIVNQQRHKITYKVYNSEVMDFKSIYQLMNFISSMDTISHSAEDCAETLRAMIAK